MAFSRARPDQAARLTQIAHAAKSYWGYPAQWIELWHNQLTITSAYIAANPVWVAVDEDLVVLGFYALTGAGERLNLEHMWVQPQSFGAGVGSMLFPSMLWSKRRPWAPGCSRSRPTPMPKASIRSWARKRWAKSPMTWRVTRVRCHSWPTGSQAAKSQRTECVDVTMSLRQRWEEHYASGHTPWDTRQTPPEVAAFWAEGRLPPAGLAVGCGLWTGNQRDSTWPGWV